MEYESLKELLLTFNNSKFINFIYKNNNFSITISKDTSDNILTPSCEEIACTADEALHQLDYDKQNYFINSEYVGRIKVFNNKTSSYFVEKGQYIEEGSILCFIEFLNIDIKIYSPVSGIISDILVNDNDVIEYGQVLFIISTSNENIDLSHKSE